MIISRGRRYIFVHPPKTGGTSLALALEARAMADDIMLGDTPKAMKRRKRLRNVKSAGRLWKHSTLRDIDGLVTPAEIDSFFVVTLVRNPWDRMVSYYHWLKTQHFDHPAVSLAQSLGFSEFLQHSFIRDSIAAAPFGAYVTGVDGREHCDLFIRLEQLDAEIAPFEAHLGFSLAPIPKLNRSDRDPDYRGYYRDADAEVVAQICAPDIERFSYKF